MTGFTKATGPKRLCVLLYGPAKSGKTRAELTFPRPAVLDFEGDATDWFADQFEFVSAKLETFAQAKPLIEAIERGEVDCETVCPDSLSAPHYRLMAAHTDDTGRVNPNAWPKIKLGERNFVQRLRDSGKHVCATAWQREEYAKRGDALDDGKTAKGNEFARKGSLPDFDIDVLHAFDLVIRTFTKGDGKNRKYFGEVAWSRATKIPAGTIIENVTFDHLMKLMGYDVPAAKPQPDAPGTITQEQIDSIESLAAELKLEGSRLRDLILGASNQRTVVLQELSTLEAKRAEHTLRKKLDQGAA